MNTLDLSVKTDFQTSHTKLIIKKSTVIRDQKVKEFSDYFKTDIACFSFLMDCKWKDGFKCRKCGGTTPCKGKKWHHKRCTKCGYDESATAGTLFHKLKFPVLKAFKICYQLTVNEEGCSSYQISKEFKISQETAWYFKRKVQQAMGRFETESIFQGNNGKIFARSKHHLKKNCLNEAKIEVKTILDYFIDDDSKLIASKIRSIRQTNKKQSPPIKNEFSKDLHRKALGNLWLKRFGIGKTNYRKGLLEFRNEIIHLIKSAHHHISSKHLFFYCSEYNFRSKTKNNKIESFHQCLSAMVIHPWLPYKLIRAT
jgi:hypothetical protein